MLVTVAHGLVRPWHLTFLPGGTDYLVTELPGNLRIVRNGRLDPQPVPGWPADALRARSMNSVVLHPDFARNRQLFISYVKQRDGGDTTVALARGRFVGRLLAHIQQHDRISGEGCAQLGCADGGFFRLHHVETGCGGQPWVSPRAFRAQA